MPRKKRSELAAGIFVVGALAATLGVVLWIGAADLFRPAGQKAVFYAEEAGGSYGLEVGNFVQVGDDPVGKLAEVRFDPTAGRTYYVAVIERPDIHIYADGNAVAAAGFIGGARLIVTSRGSDNKPLAGWKDPIRLGRGGFMGAMASLSEQIGGELDRTRAESLLAKIHAIVDGLKGAAYEVGKIASVLRNETDPNRAEALLAKVHSGVGNLRAATDLVLKELKPVQPDALLAKVHHSADDLNRISANIGRQVDPNAAGSAMAKLHTSLNDVNQISADARPKLEKTLTAIQSAAEKIESYTRQDVAEILAKVRRISDEVLKIAVDVSAVSGQVRQMTVVNRDRIDEIIDNMTLVSAELKTTAKEVRRNPWRLLYRPQDKELRSKNIYDAAHAFADGAEQLDQAIAKLAALRKAHPQGVPADDPELAKIRQQVEQSFSRFSKVEQALWDELTK